VYFVNKVLHKWVFTTYLHEIYTSMTDKRMDGGQNSQENQIARKAYREYYDKQSAEVKAKLPAPESGDDVTGMDGQWVFSVDEERMGNDFAYSERMDVEKDSEPVGRLYTEDEVQEVIRRVIMAMQMSEHPDVLFQARCILIALGIGEPPKESELARIKGCSRQFVSKKVKRIQALFNLTPSQFMRSNEACKAYSKAYWEKRQRSARRKNNFNMKKDNNNE
jgi:hypothetical protein